MVVTSQAIYLGQEKLQRGIQTEKIKEENGIETGAVIK